MLKNCKLVQKYVFGRGACKNLSTILADRRSDNAPVVYVIDHFFKGRDVEGSVDVQKGDIVLYADTTDEPHADYVNALVDGVKTGLGSKLPGAVVGMGGGSAMDIAKCISILLTNPGRAEDYQGWDLVKQPAVFKIAVPTISGTGAEGTRTAVITSKIKKLGMNSDYSVYDQIILDPDFMDTVPKDQFFHTAMDCYIHDVESLRGSMIDAMSKAFAEKSLELVRSCFRDEMDPEKLMVASFLGGMAVANSNVGIAHPLSYGLSLVLGFHHGIANCIVFDKLEEYYPETYEFRDFLKTFGVDIPRNVMAQVTDDQFERMAEATLKNERPLENAFGPNWRQEFTKETVIKLLKRM